MNYIHEATGTVLSIAAIREAHPNMSIPDGADLSDIGYERVYPALTTQIATESEVLVSMPPEKVDGVWREVFAVEAAPVVVPQQITRAQGKATLIKTGRWSAILAYVETISDPTEKAMAQVAVHDTLNWERTSPTVIQAAAALGMTSAELDELFISAAKVVL